MADTVKISNAGLGHEVERRTVQVSALYEIASTVNRSLDLDKALQNVVARISHIFQFDRTEVYLFDADRQEVVSRACFEADSEALSDSLHFPQASGLARRVAECGEPLVIDDLQQHSRYWEAADETREYSLPFRFLALLPIQVPGKCLGTLSLSAKGVRTLIDEEHTVLTAICEHIAAAVEKANLFDQLTTRFRHLEALNMIGATVSQSLEIGEVLDRAVDKIAKTLAFDAVWIYHSDETDGLVHMKAFYGLGDEMAASMGPRSAEAGINGEVIGTGERVVLEDIGHEAPSRAGSWEGMALSRGFKSAAAFPIKTKEKVVGVLYVADRSRRHFTLDDLQLIESIARSVGVAIENAMLFAEISRKTGELAATNQELLEATQAKTEFIAAMSHELRTPLNVVIGSSDLLRDGFFGALSDGQRDATDKISRNARILLKMINDVLTISRFDANRVSIDISTVGIEEILRQARAIVEQMNRDNRLEVRWFVDSDIPPITTDALKVEEILQNLIGNAFKFTPGGHIEIRVKHRAEDDRIEFSVADTGIGIAAEDQSRIFDAFEQLKDAHTGHFNGVGLGLSIVKRYLQLLNGEIAVESDPGRGSKFTFSVPRSLQFDS